MRTHFTELYQFNVQWRLFGTLSLSTSRQFSLKYGTHLFFEYFERCMLKKDDDDNSYNIMVPFHTKNDDCRQVSRVVFAKGDFVILPETRYDGYIDIISCWF